MAKEKEVKNGHHYDASDISVLEGLDPVRRRPGMYIGTTGPEGLHHLIWEIFDNSRDEAMGGFCDDIEVVLLPGNRIRVADNGRGIPVDIHKKTKVSALETVMTTLHAGGKFVVFSPVKKKPKYILRKRVNVTRTTISMWVRSVLGYPLNRMHTRPVKSTSWNLN